MSLALLNFLSSKYHIIVELILMLLALGLSIRGYRKGSLGKVSTFIVLFALGMAAMRLVWMLTGYLPS